ncbi:MAG: hypothetical protein KAU22_02800, partial [Desulfuromonadales bacterium]|nr:hypothetical protein [Desulfuromonadales bacterium]
FNLDTKKNKNLFFGFKTLKTFLTLVVLVSLVATERFGPFSPSQRLSVKSFNFLATNRFSFSNK